MKKDNNGWVCTDTDEDQFGIKIADGHYRFKDRFTGETDIILSDYSEEFIIRCLASYGYNREPVSDFYGDEYDWIIAECIFEQEYAQYRLQG